MSAKIAVRRLLLDLPDDQPVIDQLEWADAEIARKQRSNDPVANPPGFYVYILQADYPVPANFETSRKRRIREQAEKKEFDSRAKEAAHELELYEQKEKYEGFLIEQTNAHLKNLSPAMTDRLVRGHMKRIKDEYSQYQWPDPSLRDFAWRRLRHEIASELNLPTFEEYVKQAEQRLF